jgi:hypothetical protein
MPLTPDNIRPDEPAIDPVAVHAECHERLRIAIEAEGDNRQRGMRCLDFLDGHQWADDLYNQRRIARRPSLTINHTRTFRNRVVNNMKIQRPRMKVHPVGMGANKDKAELVNGILRHIENISTADIAYDTGGASSVDIGWGYARVVGDYPDDRAMHQDIFIKPIRNTFTVYMDPDAVMPAGEDAQWVIISETLKRDAYKRLYPKASNAEWIGSWGQGDTQRTWETKTTIRLAEYYRIRTMTETLYLYDNGMTLFADEAKRLKSRLEAVDAQVIHERPAARRYVEWYRINGRSVVDSRCKGNRDESKGPLPGRYIPVVRFLGNVLDVEGRVKFKGMIEDMIGPAQMYNYWRTAETEQLALASKAPWVGPEGFKGGRQEWDDANQTPYSALEYVPQYLEGPNGEKVPLPPPTRQPAIEIPAGFVQAAQSAEHDLMAIAGMPHEPGQDKPGQVVSGVALRQRQALSDIGHYQYYANQQLAIQQIGRICVSWFPFYYNQPNRIMRIIGEDGVPSMVTVNREVKHQGALLSIENDLTMGEYDIVMDTGPGYESKRQEEAERAVDMLRIPGMAEACKPAWDLVLRYFGMDDIADRIAPTLPGGLQEVLEQLPKSAQGVVQALIAQLNAVNQKNQQLEADLKYGLTKTLHQDATKLQIEHLKDKRAERDTDVDNATKRFDTHVRSITARDVAEIQVAGKLLDTHAAAGHAAKADEKRMLHEGVQAERDRDLSERQSARSEQ